MAKNMNLILIVAAVVGLLFFMGVFDKEAEAPAVPGVPSEIVCESSTTPDLDINAYDAENPGSSLTEATNIYRKVGDNSWTAFTAGTAITNLQVGKQYEVAMGVNLSSHLEAAYGQYFVTEPIPCAELTSLDKKMYNDELETSLTATFYNKNHDAAAETFTAGQIKKVYGLFEAANDEFYGNPFIAESGISGPQRAEYPNVACLDLNSTAWDKPVKVSFDGVDMNRVSTPIRHTAVASEIAYCYEAPIISENGQELMFELDADDTNAPAADDTVLLYSADFYLDLDDGNIKWGIEDEDGNAVGNDAADSLTLDFS